MISGDVRLAKSIFARTKGLMLSKPDDLVLISPKEDISSSSIHMCFMRIPIDVIWLDSQKRVVDIRKNIPPNRLRIYRPKKPAKYVVELGIGKIGNSEIGDIIEFSDGIETE